MRINNDIIRFAMITKYSKYYPLYEYLNGQDAQQVTLSFSKIEDIVGNPLPKTAKTLRAWWSNRSQGTQSQAWMQANYHVTEIDINQQAITFSRPKIEYSVKKVDGHVQWTGELIEGFRRHLGMTQLELANKLGVRQQTVSEWERGLYEPSKATSRYLSMVAEQANFAYKIKSENK